ncbi:3-methyladenine DNA glycosylase [Staphylococcus aureus]|nr:3-methyladenine DNA glycosylase [Staphylococcus aureus]QCW39563.1 3-methyladenine DNA glycosylase [Staphylococcus aureus]
MPSFIDYYHENEIYLLISQSIVPPTCGWVDCFFCPSYFLIHLLFLNLFLIIKYNNRIIYNY